MAETRLIQVKACMTCPMFTPPPDGVEADSTCAAVANSPEIQILFPADTYRPSWCPLRSGPITIMEDDGQ